MTEYENKERYNNMVNMESNTDNEKKHFCADCRIEFDESEMVRRKNKKGVIQWLCVRCASKYQD